MLIFKPKYFCNYFAFEKVCNILGTNKPNIA